MYIHVQLKTYEKGVAVSSWAAEEEACQDAGGRDDYMGMYIYRVNPRLTQVSDWGGWVRVRGSLLYTNGCIEAQTPA